MTARHRILDRLAKLVAMSKSPNRHEAETARCMAEAMAKAHGIGEQEIAEHQPGGLYEKPMGAKGFEKDWKFALITATARFRGCEAIALRVGPRVKVRLVGEKGRVEEAAQLFDDLMSTMLDLVKLEAEWLDKQNLVISVSSAAYSDSFRRGVTMAIIDKIKRSRAPRETVEYEAATSREPPNFSNELASKSLVRVAKSSESTAEYQEKVKSKYSPKKTTLSLDDAEDEGAFWRGYQAALARVELTPSTSSGKKAT